MRGGNHRRGSGVRGLETFKIAVIPLGVVLLPTVVTINKVGIGDGDKLRFGWLVVMIVTHGGEFFGEVTHQLRACFAIKDGTVKFVI